MSVLAPPAGTIGNTHSSLSTHTSRITGPGVRDHLLDGGPHLARLGRAQALGAVRLGELHEVGDVAHVDRGVAARVEELCHWRTMPRQPLFMITTLMFRFSATQVASSWSVIWNEPSPVMSMTVRSGLAAGRAHRRGKPVAHGAEPARREPRATVFHRVVLRGPHLVLPDVGRADRLALRDLGERLHERLRHDGLRLLPVRRAG